MPTAAMYSIRDLRWHNLVTTIFKPCTFLVINPHIKGPKSNCKNWRELTLLPTAYKIFANIVRKINAHFEEIAGKECSFRKRPQLCGCYIYHTADN